MSGGDVLRGQKWLILPQYDETGASSRIRIYNFLPYFREAGLQLTVRPLIRGNATAVMGKFAESSPAFVVVKALLNIVFQYRERIRDCWNAKYYDAVLVQKDVMPFGLRCLLRWRQRRIVFEFDDPIWLPHPSSGGASIPLLGALIVWYRRRLLEGMIRSASVVIVDNERLAAFAKLHAQPGTPVVVITEPIDTVAYQPAPAKADVLPASRLPVIGWIGSPSTTFMLKQIVPALESLGRERPFILLNVGGIPLPQSEGTGMVVENRPWSFAEEKRALEAMDIGLMHSADIPFNAFKLGYKVVQYTAAGVPCLSSDAGINSHLVEDEKTGLLYRWDDPQHFCIQAKRLIDDREFRLRLGRAARLDCEKRFSLQKLKDDFLAALRLATA